MIPAVRRASFKLDAYAYERVLGLLRTVGDTNVELHSALATSFLWWHTNDLKRLDSVPTDTLLRLVQHGAQPTPIVTGDVQLHHRGNAAATELCRLAGGGMDVEYARRALHAHRLNVSRHAVLWSASDELAKTYRRLSLAIQYRLQDCMKTSRMKAMRFPEVASISSSCVAVVEHAYCSAAEMAEGQQAGTTAASSDGPAGQHGHGLVGSSADADQPRRRGAPDPAVDVPEAPSQAAYVETVTLSARTLHMMHAYLAKLLPREPNLREYWVQRATRASAGSAASASSGSESEIEAEGNGIQATAKQKRTYGDGERHDEHGAYQHGSPRNVAVTFVPALPVLLRGISSVVRYDLETMGSQAVDKASGVHSTEAASSLQNAFLAYAALMTATKEYYSGVHKCAGQVSDAWRLSQAKVLGNTTQAAGPGPSAASAARDATDAAAPADVRQSKATRPSKKSIDEFAAASVGAPSGPETHPKYRQLFASFGTVPQVLETIRDTAGVLGLLGLERWPASDSGAISSVSSVAGRISPEERLLLIGRTHEAMAALLKAWAAGAAIASPDGLHAAAVLWSRQYSLQECARRAAHLSSALVTMHDMAVQLGLLTREQLRALEAGQRVEPQKVQGLDFVAYNSPPEALKALVLASIAHHAPRSAWPAACSNGAALGPQDLSGKDAAAMATLLHAGLQAGIACNEAVPCIQLDGLSPMDAGLMLQGQGQAVSGTALGQLARLAISCLTSHNAFVSVPQIREIASSCIPLLLRDACRALAGAGGDSGDRHARLSVAMEGIDALQAALREHPVPWRYEDANMLLHYGTELYQALDVAGPSGHTVLQVHLAPLLGLAAQALQALGATAKGSSAEFFLRTHAESVCKLLSITGKHRLGLSASSRANVDEAAKMLLAAWRHVGTVAGKGGLGRTRRVLDILEQVEQAAAAITKGPQ